LVCYINEKKKFSELDAHFQINTSSYLQVFHQMKLMGSYWKSLQCSSNAWYHVT